MIHWGHPAPGRTPRQTDRSGMLRVSLCPARLCSARLCSPLPCPPCLRGCRPQFPAQFRNSRGQHGRANPAGMWVGQQCQPHPLSLPFTGSVGASQPLAKAAALATKVHPANPARDPSRDKKKSWVGCADASITHIGVMETGTTETQQKLQLKS